MKDTKHKKSGKHRKQNKGTSLQQSRGKLLYRKWNAMNSSVPYCKSQWTQMRPQKESTRPQFPAGNALPRPSSSLLQDLKIQIQSETKRSIPNFKTSIRRGIGQHPSSINNKKKLKQQKQPYPEEKNDNFTHPRAGKRSRRRIEWIEPKGFTIWKKFRSIEWFRVEREWVVR